MPSVEVLCATMHQKDFSKIDAMNIQSNVVYANQSDDTRYDEMMFGENQAKMITTATRGVGINRNLSLLYSSGDYLLISDDDLTYVDGYADIVKKAFEEIPDADCIIFNIITIGEDFGRRHNKKSKRVRWYNALNYGAVRLAVKRTSLKREGVMFITNFGGGTKYSAGEDTLFICGMLKSGMKLYTHPAVIASVDQTTSTWFTGYNEKFYYDKGALFSAISKPWARALCLQYLVRHKYYKKNGMKFSSVYRLMKQGIEGYKTLRTYDQYIEESGASRK